VAGDIFASDPVTLALFSRFDPEGVELVARIVGAVLVVVAGFVWRRSYTIAANEK
jgi:hypothetical protein